MAVPNIIKPISLIKSALWGAFTSLGVISLAYLGNRMSGTPYVPFDLFDWLARVLPGSLVIFGIENLIKLVHLLNLGPTAAAAKQAEQIMAISLFVLLGAVFGAILGWLGNRNPSRFMRSAIAGGLVLWFLILIVEMLLGLGQAGFIASAIWLALLMAGWAAVLARLLLESKVPIPYTISLTADSPTEETEIPQETPMSKHTRAHDMSRRTFLYLVIAGVATLVLSTLRISQKPGSKSSNSAAGAAPPPGSPTPEPAIDTSMTSGPAKSPSSQELVKRFPPVPGTRPELTPAADFYRVDINLTPQEVDAKTWRLNIDGLVEHPLSLSLDELRSRPAFTQAITLECISNNVGGDLISTGIWTGLRLKDLLQEAGIHPEAQALSIQAIDGFYESVSLKDMMDDRTLLVYAMDGQPLTAEHGFPLRIYIPNRHGMKLPKWIAHIQAVVSDAPGYWVDRGWNKQAIPHTTSVIDAIDVDKVDSNGIIPVGGIAYAGGRGISRIEVQVDNGPWMEAELRTPPLSELTWVQWRYLWKSATGSHTLRVRAYDGTGALQDAANRPPTPDGATGIFEKTVLVV